MFQNLNGSSVAGNVNTDHVVPAGNMYRVLYGQIVLTTDATVANRRAIAQVLDESNNVIMDVHAGAVVAASQTDQHHEFMQGVFRETAFIGNALQVALPSDLVIPPAWKLRTTIENGQAGDSYDVNWVVSEVQAGASLYK